MIVDGTKARAVRCAWLAIALVAGTAWGQKPAAVEGVVSNAATGAGVRKALVTLRDLHTNAGYQALSDAAGRFRIDTIKPGDYGLWAEAQGYVREPGRFYAPSQALTVKEAQTVKDFAIRLEPLGAISGRVLDENDEPVAGATVDGLRYSYSAQGAQFWNRATSTTNERGEYRVFDLDPGRWYLRVGKTLAYATASGRVHRAAADAEYGETFYPGAARIEEASSILVAPGADLLQVEIRIRKARVFRVRGKVVDGASGAPAAKARVTIEDVGSVESKADGTFDARAIPRGTHRIAASLAREAGSLASGWQQVTIADRDVEGLVFRLEPLPVLQGMVTAEGAAADKQRGARVNLEPLGGLGELLRVDTTEDGRFAVPDMPLQAYRVTVDRLGAGLYLKSVRLGEQDVTESGRIEMTAGAGVLSLVLAGDGGRVAGTVQAAGPGPAPVVVTLAPVGRLAERIDLIRTEDTDAGRFEVQGVAPGEYKIWAWELADEELAGYAEFRKLLEGKATAVTVRAGEATASVALQVIPAAEVAEARGRLK
jgi:hypothetical protein